MDSDEAAAREWEAEQEAADAGEDRGTESLANAPKPRSVHGVTDEMDILNEMEEQNISGPGNKGSRHRSRTNRDLGPEAFLNDVPRPLQTFSRRKPRCRILRSLLSLRARRTTRPWTSKQTRTSRRFVDRLHCKTANVGILNAFFGSETVLELTVVFVLFKYHGSTAPRHLLRRNPSTLLLPAPFTTSKL
jgi:hypothetical protein